MQNNNHRFSNPSSLIWLAIAHHSKLCPLLSAARQMFYQQTIVSYPARFSFVSVVSYRIVSCRIVWYRVGASTTANVAIAIAIAVLPLPLGHCHVVLMRMRTQNMTMIIFSYPLYSFSFINTYILVEINIVWCWYIVTSSHRIF